MGSSRILAGLSKWKLYEVREPSRRRLAPLEFCCYEEMIYDREMALKLLHSLQLQLFNRYH